MSGPKVVRVVTREEVQAICDALLRQLDQALDSWSREVSRLSAADPEATDAAHRRRDVLASALANDAFLDVQKQVPAEIDFLQKDLAVRRERAIHAATQAAHRARQQRENAKSLVDELARRGIAHDDELGQSLRSLAQGGSLAGDAEAILSRGFARLTPSSGPAAATKAQRDLASALLVATPLTSYDAWKQAHAPAPDPRLRRLDEALAEVALLLDAATSELFADRLRSLENGAELPGFELRLDSLLVDLATAVRSARADAALLASAQRLQAEIPTDQQDAGLSAARTALLHAIANRAVADLPQIVDVCRKELNAHIARRAADARRAAILEGLAVLGYEVREGMSTAWADNGRVVLRNPALPGYGVEVASAADASRLQVRPVALAADHDARRDRDIETIWCGDFGKLQALVARQGGGLAIERALAIGETPLKVVAWENDADSRGVVVQPIAQSRS